MLQDNHVPDHQVRTGEAGHLVVREVPRHDPEQDAKRAATHYRGSVAGEQLDRLIRHQLLGVVCVEAVYVAGEVDLAERLLNRLAHLADDDLAQLLAPLDVQFADAAHQVGALGDGRRGRPRPVDFVGTTDRGAKIVVADGGVLLALVTRGRIDDCVHAHLVSPIVSVTYGLARSASAETLFGRIEP